MDRVGSGVTLLWESADIAEIVRSQLPRTLADRLHIELRSDPYHLRTTARFKDDSGRKYECQLENDRIGTRVLACRIPDVFLARLCVEV